MSPDPAVSDKTPLHLLINTKSQKSERLIAPTHLQMKQRNTYGFRTGASAKPPS